MKINELTDKDQYPIIRTMTESQPEPIVDVASGTVTYRGYADLGTGTDEAKWKIVKVLIAGTVTTTQYADGNMLYDNIWDNRATLSYSR
jgi:hypothetical protein